MIKTCFSSSFDFGQPTMELIKVSSKGPDNNFFEKRASFLDEARKDLKPKEGHVPVFILAMGDMEHFSANRNADSWPAQERNVIAHNNNKTAHIKAGLKENHDTFVTEGKIYRGHNNYDPSLSKGEIYSSSYNPKMGRVELVAYLKESEFPNEIEKIASGEHSSTSMSAKVAGDYCSYCLKYTSNPNNYCDHIKKYAGAILDDGHCVSMINDDPTFFDMSIVKNNADRISYALSKVASTNSNKIRGDLLAKELGKTCPEELLLKSSNEKLRTKVASVRKLSEIEKEINNNDPSVKIIRISKGIPSKDKRIADEDIKRLREENPGVIFKALDDSDMLLPCKEFYRLIMGPEFSKIKGTISKVEDMLPSIFTNIRENSDLGDFASAGRFEPDPMALVPKEVRNVVDKYRSDFSLDSKPVNYRIMISVVDSTGKGPKFRLNKKEEKPRDKKAELLAKEYARYQLSNICDGENSKHYLTVVNNCLDK